MTPYDITEILFQALKVILVFVSSLFEIFQSLKKKIGVFHICQKKRKKKEETRDSPRALAKNFIKGIECFATNTTLVTGLLVRNGLQL